MHQMQNQMIFLGIHNQRRREGGQPKVDYSSNFLEIHESIKGGGRGGSKKRKNESTSFMDASFECRHSMRINR